MSLDDNLTLTGPMNPDVKAQWLEALRSDEFIQGREQLKGEIWNNDEDEVIDFEYCCLGVLCELASRAGVGGWDNTEGRETRYATPAMVNGFPDRSWSTLPYGVQQWAGISVCDPAVRDPNGGRTTLSALNDEGKSFEFIADVIEEDL